MAERNAAMVSSQGKGESKRSWDGSYRSTMAAVDSPPKSATRPPRRLIAPMIHSTRRMSSFFETPCKSRKVEGGASESEGGASEPEKTRLVGPQREEGGRDERRGHGDAGR